MNSLNTQVGQSYSGRKRHWLCKIGHHRMSKWDNFETLIVGQTMWARYCKRAGCDYHEEEA